MEKGVRKAINKRLHYLQTGNKVLGAYARLQNRVAAVKSELMMDFISWLVPILDEEQANLVADKLEELNQIQDEKLAQITLRNEEAS